ncbi:uncharacterized protein LOC132613035 [Lycium barbarum]|uniref:uncharacterized protein LOC132613035 n=1 Tax=Lycium barbarum TaxID=112863 RepID=UPI00293EC359|nr:uncharacterized protein LOC132613035 [Lycium barbarum]
MVDTMFQIDTSIEEVSYFMHADGCDTQKFIDKLPAVISNAGIGIRDPAVSSFDMEVKEHQYEDPQLSRYTDTFHENEKSPFEVSIDGCNTDGASKGNLGLSSAAFCIRDELGNLVFAGARRIYDTTNISEEDVAIQDGIEYCIKKQLFPMVIEPNSLSMVKIMQGEWDDPWKINLEVSKIRYWRNKGKVPFAHILREGNALVDFLANLVFNFKSYQ